MKKLLLTLILSLFLLSFVSAAKIDYSPNENGIENMKAHVKDTTLFGLIQVGEQGTMELKSHKKPNEAIKVEKGNSITMIYDFNFKELYSNNLGEITFIDMRTGQEVNRNYKFVYATEGEWKIPIYKEVCSNEEQLKPEEERNCDWVFDYYEYHPRTIWNEYNSKDIPKGKITLGLQVEVLENDYIDGIWTVANKKIDKHASWIEGKTEYIYAGGTGSQIIVKYDNDFNIVAVSPNYGGTIRSINTDDNFVYYGGQTVDIVRKAYKENLTTITDSPSYSGDILSITIDDDFVYYGGASSQTVRKAYKTNLTTITNSPNYGSTIRSITIDDDFVYYAGDTTQKVRKAYKTNLNTITDSPIYGGSIYSITIDDDFVYYGGASSQTVRKAYKTNLTTITDSPTYGGGIEEVTTDDNFVYYGGQTVDIVRKAYKENLTTITDSPTYGGDIYSLAIDNDFVYYGGASSQKVRKAYKENLTTITDSPSYSGIILSISLEKMSELIINLFYPENNSMLGTIEQIANINFNFEVTDEASLGIKNVSLVINDTIYQTNTSQALGNYSFTENLSEGVYSWKITAYDSTEVLYESEIRTFEIQKVPFVENNRIYNLTSFETKQETFSINLTANASLTAVKLLYNETEYATTKSGSVYSTTLDIPSENLGNNSIRWKLTYEGDTMYSDYSYQEVSPTVFALCNATYTDDYLNISFKDEADLTPINATITTSTFEYYLGSGTETKSLTYINNTENYFYNFCATPNLTFHVDPYVQFKKGTEYPQRIWDADVTDYTSNVTQQILYLLSNVDGIYVTFQTINAAEQGISGVEVIGTRVIEGEDVVVANGVTDLSGGVTFWLNPDFIHTFTFTKDGYDQFEYITAPTQSAYTITLASGESEELDCSQGVSYKAYPSKPQLDQDTVNDFQFEISSSFLALDNFTASLYDENQTLLFTDSSITQEGGIISFDDFNVTDQARVYLAYSYSVNGTVCLDSSRYWIIQSTEGRDFSIYRLISDIDTSLTLNLFGVNGESGESNFGRMLLSFILLVTVAGVTISKFGIQSESMVIGIVFAMILLLEYTFAIIPPIVVLGNEIKYMVSIIAGLAWIVFAIRDSR